MPSFLLHFALLEATPLETTNLRSNLLKLGFTDTLVSGNKLVYQLPPSVYHCTAYATKDQVMDCVKRVALRQRRKYHVLVTEIAGSAWVGLSMLGRETDAHKRDLAEVSLSPETSC